MYYRIDDKLRKPTFIIFLIIIALFILSRSIFLERDLPSSTISSYVAIDELYYTIPAFNLYHYGAMVHNVVPLIEQQPSKDTQPTNILENILTYLTLFLFGNNYYGLRMASVLAALISFILLYLILRKIVNGNLQGDMYRFDKEDNKIYVLYFVMAYLLCDFSFLMAGRVAEPTIFRILAMMIVIYIGSLLCLSKALRSKWYALLIGFLSVAAVVFVYIYNIFIFFAMLVTVFAWAYKAGFRNAVKQCAFFLLGGTLAMLTYQLFIDLTFHSSIYQVFQSFIPYQDRMGLGVSHTDRIQSYLLNIIFVFLTNIFRFNTILLFLFFGSLPVFFKKLKTERNNFDILIFNLTMFLLMQSVIINDYPLRKLIILLPLVVILITISYTNVGRYFSKDKITEKERRFINLYLFSAFIISLSILVINFIPQITGESAAELGNFMYLNLGVFITASVIMIVKYFWGVRIPKVGVIVCLILILLPNLYMCNKYVFFNRTFHFRDAMISMSEKIDGKIIVGGCSYGFRLYNKSIPIWDFYRFECGSSEQQLQYNMEFDQMFAEGIGSYSIAFTAEEIDNPIGRYYMTQHGLKLQDEYELGESIRSNIGLYLPK